MASFRILLFTFLVFGGFGVLVAQIAPSNVPDTIQTGCYRNITAFDRYKRQPMRIENLISIIRKLEQKTNYNWDMRRLTRTIIKRYQFDGMEYHPDKQLEYVYGQWPLEGIKSQIILEMIPAPDTFPDGALDNDEMCALHWMISHSMNATMRADEEPDRYGRAYKGELKAKRKRSIDDSDEIDDDDSVEIDIIHFSASNSDGTVHRVARSIDKRTTNRPVETGVVYTKWGSISAGRLIAGIAAGLEPQEKPVIYVPTNNGGSNPNSNGGGSGTFGNNNPSNNPSAGGNGNSGSSNNWVFPQYTGKRNKRQVYGPITFVNIKNVFAATLGGDIGQAAILNAPFKLQSVSPPSGHWNDSICPREYVLNALPNPDTDTHHDHDTWTYLTASEIRGGIDGLVLGSRIRNWDRGSTGTGLRLSQVLEMYYSEGGVAGDTTYRSCDRYTLFQGSPEAGELREQAKSFAYEFNSRVSKVGISDDTTSAFTKLVEDAYQKMISYGSSLNSLDGVCVRRPTPVGGAEIRDQDKYTDIKTTVYAVLDHSVTDIYEIKQQQRFLAQLAFDLNVSPKGSRLGLVDGGSGNIILKPNDTDNAAILACRIIDQPQLLRNQDVIVALKAIKTEILRIEQLEKRTDPTNGVGNGIVIMVFVQGKKLDENRVEDLKDILRDFNETQGDVQVLYVSSKYNQGDFDNFVLDPNENNFIKIRGSQNMSDDTGDFIKEFVKKSHGLLQYQQCDPEEFVDQSQEYAQSYNIFVNPASIQFYKVNPDHFFKSVDLRFRFTSEYGKARICISREEKFPTSIHDVDLKDNTWCNETSGNYEVPGGPRTDLEFAFVKPCKNRKREGCQPYYISITPTASIMQGSGVPIDCLAYGCVTPDQLKVTWSHYGMRCGAIGLFVSTTGSVITAIVSLLYFYKSF